MKMIYLCNPRANAECRKDACQKECFFTTKKEYALNPDGLYYCETAIPVQWIRDYIDYTFLPPGDYFALEKMLKEWDNENNSD